MRTARPVNNKPWCAGSLLAIIVACSAVSAQESIPARVTVLNSTIDFGEVAPSASAGRAVADGNLSVRLTTDAIWQLSIVRDAIGGGSQQATETVSANVDGTWIALLAGMPVVIASGQATPAEGMLVVARLRIAPTFEMRPGPRQFSFSLTLNGQRIAGPIRLQYVVAATLMLDNDNNPFALNADRPSEMRQYDLQPRVYTVRSNVPWILEIATQNPTGSGRELPPYTVEVLDSNGIYKTLTGSIIAGAGSPTGEAGVQVPIRLRVKLAEVPLAGAYATNIEVRARLAGGQE